MSAFKSITETLAVAPQIALSDLAVAADEGFSLVINNRPDGETSDQPSSAAIEDAARAAGLDYLWIPVTGGPTDAQADAQAEAVSKAAKTLAFCRSGTRSINTWALGQIRSGEMTAESLIPLGSGAGYDLSWLRGYQR